MLHKGGGAQNVADLIQSHVLSDFEISSKCVHNSTTFLHVVILITNTQTNAQTPQESHYTPL